jgi:formate dehydrogenase major subunit
MVQLTIDGKAIETPQGATVLQAARMAGIEIPTLCDHPALKPYGGCRLCVVEIDGFRTLQASCTMPASNGMVVHTDTEKVKLARTFVLTMLFSERNHFCPYCQKSGGDCELQNSAYGEGMTHWPLVPAWKNFEVDGSHPYYVFDHNRCILCRRCVRACGELVGNFTLNMENRGARTLVVADTGTPLGESSCIRCGTCVQSCPTGALIDRQGVYAGLETQVEHIPSVCVGCSVGCGVDLLVRDNQLLRVNGDWEAPLNQGVLCETGRYTSQKDERPRLKTPLVRKNGALVPATWEEAYAVLGEKLGTAAKKNGSGLAALASTRLPAEALYTFKELFATQLGSQMVASIEEDQTTALPQAIGREGSLDDLKEADVVMMVGADLAKNHQVAGFFVKRNLAQGTRLITVDPQETGLDDLADYVLRPGRGKDAELFQGILAAIVNLGLGEAPAGYDASAQQPAAAAQATGVPAESILATARLLATAKKAVIVFGKGLVRNAAALQALSTLASVANAALINTKGKANSLAAHAYGLDRTFQPQGYQAIYLALGDDYPTPRLEERLVGAPFLAVQASHVSPLTEHADVVLPVTAWAEQEGHYLNLDGRLQKAVGAIDAPRGIESNLSVLQSLATRMGQSTSAASASSATAWKEPLSGFVR